MAALDTPWPDRTALATIRHRLRFLGRTVVVFDGQAEQSVMSAESPTSLPAGVLVEPAGAGRWRVAVEPLSWLTGRHQRRGLAFRARWATAGVPVRAVQQPVTHIEWDLVDSDEPLRFVYRRGSMDLRELCDVIDLLYRQPESGRSTGRLAA